MRTAANSSTKHQPRAESAPIPDESARLKDLIVNTLEDAKAEEIVAIDVRRRTAMADFMVIATGLANRHVGALADRVADTLKKSNLGPVRIEGVPECNWVLIDAGSVIVHLFQPEARSFYNLEKMWSGPLPDGASEPAIAPPMQQSEPTEHDASSR